MHRQDFGNSVPGERFPTGGLARARSARHEHLPLTATPRLRRVIASSAMEFPHGGHVHAALLARATLRINGCEAAGRRAAAAGMI